MLLAAAPAASVAKTYNVDMTAKLKLSGSGITVRVTGTPVGKCAGKATLESTGALFRTKCKDGRLRVRVTFKKGDQSHGRWKLVSGTGRYKGATGSGRYTGSVKTLRFHMTGTATA